MPETTPRESVGADPLILPFTQHHNVRIAGKSGTRVHALRGPMLYWTVHIP